jgi:hypothetical protein
VHGFDGSGATCSNWKRIVANFLLDLYLISSPSLGAKHKRAQMTNQLQKYGAIAIDQEDRKVGLSPNDSVLLVDHGRNYTMTFVTFLVLAMAAVPLLMSHDYPRADGSNLPLWSSSSTMNKSLTTLAMIRLQLGVIATTKAQNTLVALVILYS